MGRMDQYIKALAAVILVAGFSTSCITDEATGGGTGTETVTLAINVPGTSRSSSTRALADYEAECTVAEVDVLQFATDGTFAHRATGSSMTGQGPDDFRTTFQAQLLIGEYDLVVIANARGAVNAAINGANGSAMQDVLNDINISIAADEKITIDVLPVLPMFGIKKGVTVDLETGLSDNSAIPVVRMVAKIDVILSDKAASGEDDGEGYDNFALASARLYNQALRGWVAPQISTWPQTGDTSTDNIATTTWFGGNSAPTKAVYVADPSDAPLIYTGSGDNVVSGSITHSIYTFEAPAGSEAGRDTNVCLVVGGYYDGSGEESFYRVDLRDGSEYLPILRNYHYVIRVVSVTGPGYKNPDDAFDGTPQLEAEVLVWNEMAQEIIFDRQWYLRVEEDEVFLNGDGTWDEEPFGIETDYSISDRGFPAGLFLTVEYADGDENAPWLTLHNVAGADGSLNRTIGFSATNNGTDFPRTAKVHVTAGNMTKIINVTQATGTPTPLSGYGLAPPGVIGIKHSDLVKLRNGEYTLGDGNYGLTIRGSSTYGELDPDLYPFAHTDEFGGLEEEPVYAVYFKWGSTIAMIDYSQTDVTSFTRKDVVWTNPEFDVNTIREPCDENQWNSYNDITHAERIANGDNEIVSDPTSGHGDPCALFNSDDENFLFGNGKTWRTPKGNPWQYSDGTTPFGTGHTYGWPHYLTVSAGDNSNRGATDADCSIFLPSFGYRDDQGNIPTAGVDGLYWSSCGTDTYPYELWFNQSDMYSSQNDIHTYNQGLTVRCVEAAPEPKPEPITNLGYVLASPGVVGIKHSDLQKLRSGEYSLGEDQYSLTIRGSSTYGDPLYNPDTYELPFTEGIDVDDDGAKDGLEDEPVYVVTFKWGSMVAMINSLNFTVWGNGSEVVWVNPDYNSPANWSAVLYNSFTPAPSNGGIYANGRDFDFSAADARDKGHGDICMEITGGTWMMPTGNPWTLTEPYSGTTTPFGSTDGWGGGSVMSWTGDIYIGLTPDDVIGGALSSNGDLYLPAAGYRALNGQMNMPGSYGRYWTSTLRDYEADAGGYLYPYTLLITPMNQKPSDSYAGDFGQSVRCTPAP